MAQSSTTRTVEPTIEREVLRTQLTTSTTVVTDVAAAGALPFTGVSAVRLELDHQVSLALSGPGNDASGGLDNAAFPFAARF